MTFQELYIRGTEENIQHFEQNIGLNLHEGWTFREDDYDVYHYLIFDYSHGLFPNASVWITKKIGEENCYYVTNIVPTDDDVREITKQQYNGILDLFRTEVIESYVDTFPDNPITLAER